jgi:hypothetical protein
MKPTLTDKLIAYLTLLSGLAISGVAEYYSIMGLIAIYPAALTPIVIMGIVLGLGKISGTVWLKQNWEWSPNFLKAYVLPAILVLMMITSLGVFGFLSKAHSDQSLVSGDVQSKVAVYDEKIKTEKENIEANRKALKQMDEGVDSVLGRSTSEQGADKAMALRRAQQKERSRLQNEISQSQKSISELNDARAPIAAEVRTVEAEVGPIKYIAHLFYGENPDANVLEKSVIWVTVLIVVVLDPLAVVLLLASQYSFQQFREFEEDQKVKDWFEQGKERARQLDQEAADDLLKQEEVANNNPDNIVGVVAQELAEALPEAVTTEFEGIREPNGTWVRTGPNFDTVTADDTSYVVHQPVFRNRIFRKPQEGYIQNEEQANSNLWAKTTGKE